MIKILHLSDLHFCTDARTNNMKNTILDEVKRDVQENRDAERLLIITGAFIDRLSRKGAGGTALWAPKSGSPRNTCIITAA